MSAEETAWPSRRVGRGGFLHPPQAKYSQETRDLLQILMEEAKMSMLIRKRVDYHLHSGKPLPTTPNPSRHPKFTNQYEVNKSYEMRLQPRFICRRSYEAIKASGAFEQLKYHPSPCLKPSNDELKLRLQEKMSGMKIYTEGNLKILERVIKKKEFNLDINDQIDELLAEIFERDEWLKEMEILGEATKYRTMIQSQTKKKLKEIKSLEKKRDALRKTD